MTEVFTSRGPSYSPLKYEDTIGVISGTHMLISVNIYQPVTNRNLKLVNLGTYVAK